MLRAGAQYPTNRIEASTDETRSLLWTDLSTSGFPPSPSLSHGKNYSRLRLISRRTAQAMRSDCLHVSCSAPASEPCQHQDGGATKSGRGAWYPQLCSAPAEEHRVNFRCAQLEAAPLTLAGLVTSLHLRAHSLCKISSQLLRVWSDLQAARGRGREQDHCHCELRERESTQAVFSFQTWDFCLLELRQEIFQNTKTARGKRQPVYNCWRGQRNGFPNGNVTAQGFTAESLRTRSHRCLRWM